ncbi:MAG: hypothetical protein LBF93_07620 [Zoogloeaceae bacterium]|jgi:hypothetical protein|nr:hypothetical protein [Zoogloeaceae bacterium]
MTKKETGAAPAENAAPAPSVEQEEDRIAALSALESAADAVGAAESRLKAEEARADASEAEEWAAVPSLLGSMLAIYAPDVAQVFTPAACAAWGAAAVPVARKYGWSVKNMGCEAGLVVATLPMAIGAWQVLRDERDRREGWERYKKHSESIGDAPAQRAQKEREAESGGGIGKMPNVKTVIFGNGAAA